MRRHFIVPFLALAATYGASAQSCTNLQCQQVACPAGSTTSISGVVYAPNGVDPLPYVTVYIPNDIVQPFQPGITCPTTTPTPSGSPIATATTGTDGSFTLGNVPVGTNIPLVILSGRWRRQFVIPSTTACQNTAVASPTLAFPKDQTQGDIPKIAVATGSADAVECVLRKVGVSDSEFTDPTGTGRINLYGAIDSPGAIIDSNTPSSSTLLSNIATLDNYDVLMLPCEGGEFPKPSADLANIISYANNGGRIYSSHYSYVWMYKNPPFNGVVNWNVNGPHQSVTPDPGTATVNTNFPAGNTLADWLQLVHATTTRTQMTVSTLRKDFTTVNAPTETWLTLNNTSYNNPVMQFVFDTPIGQSTGQCGRVLFNEYHVENPAGLSRTFPNECANTTMTPQEKLLEYSLFELTNDGAPPTMSPTSANFGDYAVGFSTAGTPFTVTNNSSFAISLSSVSVTGDFTILSNNCANVIGGGTCTISVAFSPTALGVRNGTLSAVSGTTTLTATLTGTGVPGLAFAIHNIDFGTVYYPLSSTKQIILYNTAPGPLPVPGFTTSPSDFTWSSPCTTVPANSSCPLNIRFAPTSFTAETGQLLVPGTDPLYVNLTAALTGTGAEALALTPPSINFGNVYYQFSASQPLTLTNIAPGTVPVPTFTTTGDYSLAVPCATIPANSTCTLTATFAPTALGARTGGTTATSDPLYSNLTSSFTGNGLEGLSIPVNTLTFGNVDVGFPATQLVTIFNSAPGPLAMPAFTISGDYTFAPGCAQIPGNGSCTIAVTFTPSGTGPRPGTLAETGNTVYANLVVAISGNGVDFSVAMSPASGSVPRGMNIVPMLTITPVAGYNNTVSISCALPASVAGSTCVVNTTSPLGPTAAVSLPVTITTTAKYKTYGFGSLGGRGLLGLASLATMLLLFSQRRRMHSVLRTALTLLLIAVGATSLSGCDGSYPAENPVFTQYGTYTYTLTVTDGQLVHSATYSLNVTPQN